MIEAVQELTPAALVVLFGTVVFCCGMLASGLTEASGTFLYPQQRAALARERAQIASERRRAKLVGDLRLSLVKEVVAELKAFILQPLDAQRDLNTPLVKSNLNLPGKKELEAAIKRLAKEVSEDA